MIDMNNLKTINDTYGHKMGDLYIGGSCSLIREIFADSFIYRIGGDEFIVILQGDDYINRNERIISIRNRYKDAMSREDVDPWNRYSAAVGLAEFSAEDNTIDLVIKRADKAMYLDKKRIKAEKHI